MGVECLAAYSIPIPILDELDIINISTRDEMIPLSIGDIRDRHKIGQSDYGQAWSGDDVITMDQGPCLGCDECAPSNYCPTGALFRTNDKIGMDRTRCTNCGICTFSCPEGCFKGDLGSITAKIDGEVRTIPVVSRNSNREGATRTMDDLKRRILDGTFKMTAKVADLS